MQHTTTDNKPKLSLKIATIITLFMVYRISAGLYLSEVGQGIAEFWAVAFKGDIVIGVTAPIIAYLLWKKKSLAVWTIAIVWHWIGLKDFTTGLSFHFIEPFDPEMGDLPIVIFIIGPILHMLATYLLVKNRKEFF